MLIFHYTSFVISFLNSEGMYGTWTSLIVLSFIGTCSLCFGLVLINHIIEYTTNVKWNYTYFQFKNAFIKISNLSSSDQFMSLHEDIKVTPTIRSMLQCTGMEVFGHSNQCRICYTVLDIGYLIKNT